MPVNEHNPIARAIEKMQQKWADATTQNPDYTLACWQIDPEEAGLLNGFCKLESSPYGQLPALFVVLLTPFEGYNTFSRQLLVQWLQEWEATNPAPEPDWGFSYFQERAATTQQPDALLVELLTHFRAQHGSPTQPLVLGLIPRTVTDFAAYNQWLTEIAPKLPAGVKLMVVDHLNEDFLKPTCYQLHHRAVLIPCGDLNVQQALEEIATGGDPAAPDVQFRKCLFQMGRAAAAKDRLQVEAWGEKALLVAQRSGSQSLMATAHLVYAGFLMHFKAGSRIHQLLEEGIRRAKTGMQTGDQTCLLVLLQGYSYKSAAHSMSGERKQAARWMGQQAELALTHQLLLQALTACRLAASLFEKTSDTPSFHHYTRLGYQTGLSLDEETLRASDYLLLGSDYYQWCQQEGLHQEAQAVNEQMSHLYGPDWQEDLRKQQTKGKYVALSPAV